MLRLPADGAPSFPMQPAADESAAVFAPPQTSASHFIPRNDHEPIDIPDDKTATKTIYSRLNTLVEREVAKWSISQQLVKFGQWEGPGGILHRKEFGSFVPRD